MFPDCSPNVLGLPVKICTKCGETKSALDFAVKKTGRLGRASVCKYCDASRAREYHHNNLERSHEKNRAWKAANPERVRELNRAWAEANQDRKTEYARAYYRANRESLRAKNLAYDENHRKERREYQYRYRETVEGQAKRLAYAQSSHARDKDKVRRQKRHARKRALPDMFTVADWHIALDAFGGCCAACGRQPGLWHTLALDHWIPLVSPDCPGTVPWNIVPLCHGLNGCNHSKNDRPAADWLRDKFGVRKGNAILKRVETYLDSRRL